MGNKGTKITFDDRLRGENVTFSKGGVVASRVSKSANDHSLAFVQQEIPKGAKFQIRVEEKIKQAEGTMKIGFTTKLPKAIPTNGDDLLTTADYWVASNSSVTNFGESRAIKFDYTRLSVGDIVGIRVREDDGRICCYVNGKYKRYIDKPVNIPALRRNLTNFYAFVELTGAISKVSLLPVTNPETNGRQLGGSPRPIPKGDNHRQPHQSIKKARETSLKRSQSIPAITTVQLETTVALNSADSSGESMDEDDDVMLEENTESFKEHPVWKRRLSSSLPSESWLNSSLIMEGEPKAESKKSRHSMFEMVSDLEVTNFVSTDSIDYKPASPLAINIVAEEEETSLPLPPILQEFSIPWEEVDTDFNTAISDGAFSTSYRLKWMNAECMVTQYKRELFSDARLFAECQRLVKLRHPSLLQLLGFTRESENSDLLVIHEKLPMTLDTALKRRTTSELTIGLKLTIASDVAKALCYLHQQSPPLVHCAVIPTNIHLTASYSAKLSDSGFSKVAITSKALPPSLSRYLPLEAITNTPDVSPSLDIFTFGITLSQMITHKEPDNRNQLANDKESEKQRVTEIIGLLGEDHLLTDTVRQCLGVEPEDRPSAVKLYSLLQAVHVSLLES